MDEIKPRKYFVYTQYNDDNVKSSRLYECIVWAYSMKEAKDHYRYYWEETKGFFMVKDTFMQFLILKMVKRL